MNEVAEQARQQAIDLASWAFYSAGGTAWYEKMLMGAVALVAFLLIVIALVLVYMAFHPR